MDVKIACPCPPKADGEPRHEHDTVTLHDVLLPRVRRALNYDMGFFEVEHPDATGGEKFAYLSELYLLRCIDRWTVWGHVLRDPEHPESGTKVGPLPPSRVNIAALLIEHSRGDPVAKAADELYSEAMLLPLVLGASSSSSDGPMDKSMDSSSTPPRTNGTTHRPKRSRRSSITSIPMAVTGPMQASSGGGSSS